MSKQIIDIQELLILPPIDVPLFLALYDGQDDILIEAIEMFEKNLYDGEDEYLMDICLDAAESTLMQQNNNRND